MHMEGSKRDYEQSVNNISSSFCVSMEGVGEAAAPAEEQTVGANVSPMNRRRSGQRGSSRRTAGLNSSTNPRSSPSSSRPRPTPEQRRPASPEVGVDWTRYSFLFQKELKQSDVSATKRIVIPKALAEAYLPTLYTTEGTLIRMEDMDGLGSTWTFRFRYWINNLTRMYVLENTGEFVKAHGLSAYDFIILYKDNKNGKYVIRGSKSIYNAYPQFLMEDEGLEYHQIGGEIISGESKSLEVTAGNIGVLEISSCPNNSSHNLLLDHTPNFSIASLPNFPRRVPSFESLHLSLDDFQ